MISHLSPKSDDCHWLDESDQFVFFASLVGFVNKTLKLKSQKFPSSTPPGLRTNPKKIDIS